MPLYQSSTELLHNDEWILLQIKEGPCSAGCDYCYENKQVTEMLKKASGEGRIERADWEQMSTLQLLRESEKHRSVIKSEMTVQEINDIFLLLRDANIGKAGLIGSEPSSHSQFEQILDCADKIGIELAVYSAGLAPEKLRHKAIRVVILHLDYGRLGAEEVRRRIDAGVLPPANYMEQIASLLQDEKEVHLRVNFTSSEVPESGLVMNFFRRVPNSMRPQTQLKYSFSTRVEGDSTFDHFTPDTLRQTSGRLLAFVDQFRQEFPNVAMLAERPLFPCSFDENVWDEYTTKGGFVGSCDMEFTFYADAGLALCPPSRKLTPPRLVASAKELRARIIELRETLRESYLKPSFDVCVDCSYRKDLTCQGGCLGYKQKEETELVQLRF